MNPAQAQAPACPDPEALAQLPITAIGPELMKIMVRRYAATVWDDLDALSKAETESEPKAGATGKVKPEWAIRLKTLELKLQYLIARPMDRLQAPPPAPPEPTPQDLLAEARRSPAYQEALTELITELQG